MHLFCQKLSPQVALTTFVCVDASGHNKWANGMF